MDEIKNYIHECIALEGKLMQKSNTDLKKMYHMGCIAAYNKMLDYIKDPSVYNTKDDIEATNGGWAHN